MYALEVADPPELGWVARTRTDSEATADTELLAAPEHEWPEEPGCECERTCDACVLEIVRHG